MSKSGPLQFPCQFPIKIIGISSPNLMKEISAIILKHFPNTAATAIKVQFSESKHYQSITVVLDLHDEETLNALYLDLKAHPNIKMVL